ncbi:hypothetical protein ABPG72_013837 [Tetrahymena utriculariae]
MSNLIKKRKVFSSESESEEEEQLQTRKVVKQKTSSEPNLVKKLKKSTENLDDFEKKIEVVNQINAIKKDSLMKFLEEEDQKLSTKKRQLKTISQQEAEDIQEVQKKEEDDFEEGRDDLENNVKQEEYEVQSDLEDFDDENIKENVKKRRLRNQSYDQESTNDNKENSFDGLYSFKDDDDFYIQANKNRQQESQQEKDIIKLVQQRSGKIISRSRGYIFTVICFKNHVFDADSENIIKKWCPQCNILHQEFAQYALSQQGELESQFFQPKLNFHCKFYHRWTTSEASCMKQKVWCPKCPEVLNLMINHHHRGSVNDQERIEQIFEQAEVIADGYQVTNPQQELAFDLLKDMYFILLVPLQIYSRYLQLFKLEEQAIEFNKKYTAMHLDNNSHPLAEKVKEKLFKMFEHLLESSEDEESEEKSEKKQSNKQ